MNYSPSTNIFPSLSPNNNNAPSCNLCGRRLTRWFEKNGRWFYRCAPCGIVCIPEGVMKTDEGVSIYEEEGGPFFNLDGGFQVNYYLDETNQIVSKTRLQWILKHQKSGGKLLDAGANFGFFLKAAQEYFDSRGFDLNPTSVQWSIDHLNVKNHVASIYQIPPEMGDSFDVVTCWDTLEHLERPIEALRQIWRVLKPGGCLFIGTPNAGSPTARLMGDRWHYLDPIEHVFLFSRHALVNELEKMGFIILETRSFGRPYRLRYVFDKVFHARQARFMVWVARIGRSLPDFILDGTINIWLGDVMGIACKKGM